MAILNQIWSPKYRELLNRILRLQEGDGLQTLAPELFSTLVLELERPEWWLVRGIRMYGTRPAAGPVAAQFSAIQIFNPANSGVLAIVTQCVHEGAGGAANLRVGTANRGGGVSANTLDRRETTVGSKCIVNTFTNAAADGVAFESMNSAAATGDFPYAKCLPVVIPPNDNVTLWTSVVNVTLLASIRWFEKPVATEELTLG